MQINYLSLVMFSFEQGTYSDNFEVVSKCQLKSEIDKYAYTFMFILTCIFVAIAIIHAIYYSLFCCIVFYNI